MNLFLLLVALVPLLTEARPRAATCSIDGVAVYFGRTHRRSYCEFCHCTADGSFKCHTVAGLSSNRIACPVLTCPEHVAFIPMTAGEHQCCKVCPEDYQQEYPSFSGYRNNLAFPKMGAVGDMLTRDSPPSYQDGVSAPRTHSAGDSTIELPNARDVSVAVSDQAGAAIPDPQGLTSWAWQWGQFNDHDTTLVTELTPGAENIDIEIDVANDPDSFAENIHQQRGNWDQNTGSGPANPRAHANSISVYVDCSNVYGPDAFVAAKLRSFSDGKLKVGQNDPFGVPLPPDNDAASGLGITMAALNADDHTFALGDIRANEQNNLLATHSLFVWAHNKLADELRGHLTSGASSQVSATIMKKYNRLSTDATQRAIELDDLLYFESRKINCARMQKITYDEWIPAITGSTLPKYTGYKPEINPQFSTEFSAALFRVGHTMIQNDYDLIDNQGVSTPVTLTDIFFDTTQFANYGTRPFIHAVSSTLSQKVDIKAADSVRKSLFRMHVDLVALNVNRGREQGLSSFNDVSEILTGHRYGENGGDPFQELTGETTVANELSMAYNGRFDDVDLWIGAMAEKHSVGIFGAVVGTSIRNTFTRLRDGDRFYWENHLAPDERTLYMDGFKLGTLIRELYDDTANCAGCNNVHDANTVFGANYEDFFFCRGNGAISNCPSTCSTQLQQCNGNVMSQVHENAADGCNKFPCACQSCTNEPVEEVCGSDGQTYDNECKLNQAACRTHTDIQIVHRRECYDTAELLEFEVDVRRMSSNGNNNCNDCYFYLVQNAFGGPVGVEIDISGGGRRNKGIENAIVDIVDSCGTKRPINPLAIPEQPLPPLSNNIQLDDGEGEGVLIGTSFINYGSTVLFSGDRREPDPQLSLLYHSMLVKVGNDEYCGIITGAPIAVAETFPVGGSGSGGGFGSPSFGDSLSVLLTQPLSGASETVVKVSMDDNIRGEIRDIGGVFELRALRGCPASRDDTPNQFNYAAASRPILINGQVPPLLSFSMDRRLGDYEFTQGNPLLSVVGLESPLKQKVALYSVKDSQYVARGGPNAVPWCGEFRLAQDDHGCLLDIGRGLNAFLGGGGGFFLNEGNSTANGGISATGTMTSSSTSFLTSPTGVMILVALVVVLLAALVFLSIVLYVRSNPYTAPAPLKKVASLSGVQKGSTPITPST